MKYETEPWEWPEDLDPEDVLWVKEGDHVYDALRYALVKPWTPRALTQPWWRTLVADYNAWRSHR